jgi:hypothetical protein
MACPRKAVSLCRPRQAPGSTGLRTDLAAEWTLWLRCTPFGNASPAEDVPAARCRRPTAPAQAQVALPAHLDLILPPLPSSAVNALRPTQPRTVVPGSRELYSSPHRDLEGQAEELLRRKV